MTEDLVPVINSADWAGMSHSVCRRFFPADESSPIIVSYAMVTPEANRYLTLEAFEGLGISLDEINANAVRRWIEENSGLRWETLSLPNQEVSAMAVRGESDVISTMLLSPGHLKGIHKHFGKEMLGVIIPDRFTILAHPDLMMLEGVACSLFKDACANGTQLSPTVFVSHNGEVSGYQVSEKGGQLTRDVLENNLIKAGATSMAAAYLIVAVSGGEFDQEGLERFAEEVEAESKSGEALVHQVCKYLVETEFDLIADLSGESVEQMALLMSMMAGFKDLEEQVDPNEFQTLKQTTREILERVVAEGEDPKAQENGLEMVSDFLK